MEELNDNNSPYVMDETDRQILIFLQEQANPNVKELAERLNLSVTPIYKRIRQLEKSGYISKYVALVDRKKVGVPLIVYCSVSLNIQNAEKIELFTREINKIKEVVECYLTGGVFDFILKILVKDLEEYNRIASYKIAQIPNVGKIQSSFVLAEIKSSTIVPL